MTWSSAPVVSHATAVITSNYEVSALNSCEAPAWIRSPFVLHNCHILCIWYRPMLDTSILYWQSGTRLVDMWHDHLRWRGSIISIGFTTHLWCENSPYYFTINGGNWLHNSCRRQVSAWNYVYLRYVGGMWGTIGSHQRHDLALCRQLRTWGGGGQGPCGGCTLV